ncbi:MAG: LPS export ABC transporter permease LptF [Desulfonatronovibrionaceae bacterium]
MKILHGQILREVSLIFTVTLCSMVCLIVIGRMVDLKEVFVGQNVEFLDIIKAFVFLSPSFMGLIIPIACLLSIFLCFLRMATDRELTALQTSGISIKNLVFAPLLFSLAAFAFTLLVSMELVAWGADNFRSIALDMIRNQTRISVQPGVFNQHIPGLTIYTRRTDLESGTLEEVFIRDEATSRSPVAIIAPRGRIVSDQEQGVVVFILEKGRMYSWDQGEDLAVVSFGEYRVKLDLLGLVGGSGLKEKEPEEMSWKELQTARAQTDQDTELYRLTVLEQHKRFALPLACVILGFFAVPLGMSLQGVGRHWGLFLAVLCFIVYYSMFTAGYSLGEVGVVPLSLALWIPNICFALLAAGGFCFFGQGREINIRQMLNKFRPGRDEHVHS